MIKGIEKFLVWWGGQLVSLLPIKIRGLLESLTPILVIVIEDLAPGFEKVRLARVERSGTATVGHFSLTVENLQKLAGEIERQGKLGLRLIVPDHWMIHKNIPMPSAVMGHFETAVAYEMDRETPFTPDMVFWRASVAQTPDRHQIMVQLTLIQKRQLETILNCLNAAGIFPKSVMSQTKIGGKAIGLPGGKAARRRPGAVAAACAALIVLAISVPFIRQSYALGRMEDRIVALRPQVSEVTALRQKMGVSERPSTRVAGAPLLNDPVMLLAALTDILPDDTHLTDLALRGPDVEIAGESTGAARLIGLLSSENSFKNLRFSAPVVHMVDSGAEKFSIKAVVTH